MSLDARYKQYLAYLAVSDKMSYISLRMVCHFSVIPIVSPYPVFSNTGFLPLMSTQTALLCQYTPLVHFPFSKWLHVICFTSVVLHLLPNAALKATIISFLKMYWTHPICYRFNAIIQDLSVKNCFLQKMVVIHWLV